MKIVMEILMQNYKKNNINKLKFKIIMEKQKKMIFRKVSGTWFRVDSRELKPPTLAEILETLNILIDDDTQFCRIIRYYNNIKRTIIYRTYGGTITINIHEQ